MDVEKQNETLPKHDIWIISRGRRARFDLSTIQPGVRSTLVMEYRVSDLAKYLLNPHPIEVKKILVGCEVSNHKTFIDKIRSLIRNLLPKKMHGFVEDKRVLSETFMAVRDKNRMPLKDEGLESHITKIQTALRVYDPILKCLACLDEKETKNITGICEDVGGNRSLLNLKGDLEEKINYMGNYILKDVGVILEKAHVSEGLFEMSGFDFSTYNPRNSHRLIKFFENGMAKYCMVGHDGKVKFWLEDVSLINKMHLLEHSIKANPKFNNSLNMCSKGSAKPLRLLFKNQLEIDYTKSPLPALYKDIFKTCHIGTNGKDAVMKSLRNSQLGILFNYIPKSGGGEKKLFTNVSVMHNVKALEPIKKNLPQLYSIIDRMACVSEAGKYYLLDSMRGYTNE